MKHTVTIYQTTGQPGSCLPALFCQYARVAWPLLILLGILTGCTPNRQTEKTSAPVLSQEDRFPDKISLKYAKGFSITYFPTYKVIEVLGSFEANADTARYVLVQRGTPHPAGYPGSQVIDIPVQNLVAMSSMHLGLLDFLDAQQALVGVGNFEYVSSPVIRKRIADKKITEVGSDQTVNEELVITMHPDLMMASGSPTARVSRYKTLTDAGVPVLINSEWLETTPLGRAEWVKLMAALLNREAVVNRKFAEVETEYNRLAALTRALPDKPSVITGMSYKDAWFVPDGGSYMAQFLRDAGTTYHWNTSKATGSLGLNFEAVYPVALRADYWLNVGFANSRQDILDQDVRYGDFGSFKADRVFNYNKRVNEQGANDYWESGAINPHLVLADLIRILHPALLPTHQLVYYKQLK